MACTNEEISMQMRTVQFPPRIFISLQTFFLWHDWLVLLLSRKPHLFRPNYLHTSVPVAIPAMMDSVDHVLDHLGDLILVLKVNAQKRNTPQPSSHEDTQDNAPTQAASDTSISSTQNPPRKKRKTAQNVAPAIIKIEDDTAQHPQSSPPATASYRYRVSSRHLCLASPVFRTMLEGPWLEEAGTRDAPQEIFAEDFDPEALLIVLKAMHSRFRELPTSLELEAAREVAIVVDYYNCLEVVERFTDGWFPNVASIKLIKNATEQYFTAVLAISFIFKNEAIFKAITKLAILCSVCPFSSCSYIPQAVLGVHSPSSKLAPSFVFTYI